VSEGEDLHVSSSNDAVPARSAPDSRIPPQGFFVSSATFHYLGPSFAVVLFARLAPVGVAWIRIASAAVVLATWRRPWRVVATLDHRERSRIVAFGVVLALMNVCFYEAIDRLPLAMVAAVEFAGPVVLALAGAHQARNVAAVAAAATGVMLMMHVRLTAEPVGVIFAAANAALFAAYIVLGHQTARHHAVSSLDALALAMGVALVAVTPLGIVGAAPAFTDPALLGAGIGVGLCSSVIPYVFDQLAMARLPRPTYALFVALMPATAVAIGAIVLAQVPTPVELLGIALVVLAMAIHRPPAAIDHAGEPPEIRTIGFAARGSVSLHEIAVVPPESELAAGSEVR
jgi:inner membrane transporter RhtA